MVRSAIDFQSLRDCESVNYWSLLHGEFPWCLDDSEQTDEPSELIGVFDLVIAEPPQLTRSGASRMRTALDRCQPDTSWINYAEPFMSAHGSLLIFTPLESIGAYVGAIANAGLNYHNAFFWHNRGLSADAQSGEAILWAGRTRRQHQGLPFSEKLISAPATIQTPAEQRQWLVDLLIESFSQPETAVLEPFMTNVQVLLACQKLRRYALAIARRRSHIKQAEQILLGNLKRTA